MLQRGRRALGAVLILAGLWTAGALAQTPNAPEGLPAPRTLEELRAEVQARADRRAYPVAQLDPAEVREALANLTRLDRDEWARVWMEIGARHDARGRQLEATDRAEAAHAYLKAFEYHLFARFPLENSPGKERAYQAALASFARYAPLVDPPIEIVRIPWQGQEVVAVTRRPRDVARPPVVIAIGGLDSRKENAALRSDAYLRNGIAFIGLDMPGTGQSPVRVVAPGAEASISAVIDWVKANPAFDGDRIIVYGGSWGGHWSARLAVTERARIRGAIVQAGPVHATFQPEWQRRGVGTREYLFELFEARSAIYGARTLDEFLAYGPRMSLLTAGLLDQPSAPTLVLNGFRDTQVSIEDSLLLLGRGTPKDAWFNPAGGHMGRSAELPDERIFEQVVLPWIVRRLAPGG
jgi:pimeloyl-ACP methyl ester carboxylesterase